MQLCGEDIKSHDCSIHLTFFSLLHCVHEKKNKSSDVKKYENVVKNHDREQ